ncbi:MAG: DUF1553 domain-containing protein, partial [Acidobacteriota bacterium]|nr:DUF1553 domain-containing protein [Acidobacteriota bacterium]
TSVPLQRLFFMNSDFMQQHAERVAEQVADEPDDAARIAVVYRKLFGRAPTAEETKAGRDFLQAEALKQYEERRAKAKMPPEKDAAATDAAPDKGDAPMEGPPADGMMAGAKPGATAPEAEKKKMLPVSIFGRYVKILMSSNEFLFVS